MSTREEEHENENPPSESQRETIAPDSAANQPKSPSAANAWGATSVESMIFGPTDDSREESETDAAVSPLLSSSDATHASGSEAPDDDPRGMPSTHDGDARTSVDRPPRPTAPRVSRFPWLSSRLAFARDPRFLGIALPILGGVVIAVLTAVIMRYV